MERLNNKIKSKTKTNVGVAALGDPRFEDVARNNKGITIVTLVITIIIMLILAGVIIATTMDSDGIIADAESATKQWNNRITAQDQAIQNVLAKRNKILGGTTTEPTNPPQETPPAQSSITLNKSSIQLEIVDGVNVNETLVATKENLTGTITWTSSIPTVATVDSNGKVTTVGAGTTTITVSCGDKSATCEVTVENLISFTIEGVRYYAEPGMYWATWFTSKYNTGDFTDFQPNNVSGPAPIGVVWSPTGYIVYGLMYHPRNGLTTRLSYYWR